MIKKGLILLTTVFILFACNHDYTSGKRKGFFKIDFPKVALIIF